MSATMSATLVSAKQWFITHEQAAFFIKVIFGSILIAILAQLSIPLVPVPITGQTLGVTIAGLALGRNAGVSAVLLYLAEGAIGLPVFANGGSGIATLLGPSGGYLFGFVASAAILGYFSDKGVLKSLWKSALVTLVATAVTFVFGLIQLSYFVPAGTVLQNGLYPFIFGGIVKSLAAVVLVKPTHNFFSKL